MVDEWKKAPFHAGERAAQAHAGAVPRVAAIRDWMPDQHRIFFANLPFVLAATTDDSGWPIATILTGPPGFIASPDAKTLCIGASLDRSDPATQYLRTGAAVGLLGIDIATRRRNRANGVITASGGLLEIAVCESFGNCPRYIHTRAIGRIRTGPLPFRAIDRLDQSVRATIAAADTLFVATSDGAKRVDISHRGGKPGFVRVDEDTLTIPDFAGNHYFNTLGNMLLQPRAAVLFPTFSTGGLLQLQGQTEIVWDVPDDERFAGAERLWRLAVSGGWRRGGALVGDWSLETLSPNVALTGAW
jgi:uncharacterized protein